jgi:hypothetical protein
MRFRYAALAVVLFAVDALAQQGQLISGPTPNLPAQNNRHSLTYFDSIVRSSQQHWYWHDVRPTTPTLAPKPFIYRNAPVRTTSPGFSPGKLEWNLSGKHKLLPSLDLTVLRLRPGEPSLIEKQPGSEYGTFVSDRNPIWEKAAESLKKILMRKAASRSR